MGTLDLPLSEKGCWCLATCSRSREASRDAADMVMGVSSSWESSRGMLLCQNAA